MPINGGYLYRVCRYLCQFSGSRDIHSKHLYMLITAPNITEPFHLVVTMFEIESPQTGHALFPGREQWVVQEEERLELVWALG